MNLRNGLLAGGFALLAVVAAVGWTKAERNSSAAASTTPYAQTAANGQAATYGQAVNPASEQATNPPANGQAADYNSSANGSSASGTYSSGNGTYASGTYASNAVYGNSQRPCVDTGTGGAYQYYPDDRYVQSIHRPVVVRQYVGPQRVVSDRVYSTTEVRLHHHRSGKKSLAIVAGSAGVGAAVGALAGGGKGAGIGALAGGAGGFIYDRLTHNR
ncbi:MAG TPA: hypothetical protein VGV35_02165 [Bryobacteraceae bacterium]|nr:hypothetical protein [Bryobacteraceae bacterium]